MSIKDKIVSIETAKTLCDQYKNTGKKIVFTNGCFDLLHFGHVDYLEKASDLGDILVLGLNSDTSIQSIKGENRPIVDENSRSRIMASLEMVSHVVVFDESTPEQLIQSIQPDILVKGSDYQEKDIIGAHFVIANGGTVETIDFVDGYSTSTIISKIKNM